MKTNSELLATGLIATGLTFLLSIGLIILHYLVFKRLMTKKNQDTSLNKSYLAIQLALVISIGYCIYITYVPLTNALEIIRMNQMAGYSTSLQSIAGYGAIAFSFSIINSALVLYFGTAFFKTNPKKIIEEDNWSVAVIVSLVIIAVIIINGYGLQAILQAFIPKIETPKIN